MQWPNDRIDIVIDGHKIDAAPNDYVPGLLQSIEQWPDPVLKNDALALLPQKLAPQVFGHTEYEKRTKILAVATVYASLGLMSGGACTSCIDTLKELVP